MSTPYRDKWTSDCGTVTLYCGDCLEILPTLEPRSVDCVIDPPYGIDENDRKIASRGKLARPRDYGIVEWDKSTQPERVEATQLASVDQVVFGGNYYELPPAKCWLIWDKLNGGNDFADCELAWTNLQQAVRIFRFRWNGMIRDEKGPRVHPTQKPVALMQWAVSFFKSSRPVLDTFMGSGTTGVACVRLGRRFIGIELEPKYYAIAKRRIQDELNRVKFLEPKQRETQRTLLEVSQ